MQDDDALLDADRQARLDALDVGRSFIVQAPAGSGKTELLIQRYLKLLATVVSPEEVLAITFTRKAAAEMQQRVVAALERAQAGATSEFEHEQRTLEAAAEVLDRDRVHDWQLINMPRRMRIQTLDGFCAGTARLLPLTSGLGGTINTVQDADAKTLYRAAALATLDWLVGDDAVGEAVEQVLTHLDTSTGTYVGYVSRMLETRDQWLEITGSGEIGDADAVRSRLEYNLSDVVRHHLTAAGRRLQVLDTEKAAALGRYAAGNLLDAGNVDHPAAVLADRTTIPGADPADLPAWRGLAELLLTRPGAPRKTVNRNQGFPPGDGGQKQDWLALISALADDAELAPMLHGVRQLPDPRYDDQQWTILLALFRVLPLAVSELKRLFAEQGVCDHVEVALAADAALGSADSPGDIALLLDYRIQHLLVDEMQDTSIGQYRMLETLTSGWESGDGRTFFCVGDPMQSVYRFRNAEVGQFVQARTNGIGDLTLEPLTLRRNFRSGEHLVHWYNTVFGQVFPSEDDMASGAVSYTESVPVAARLGQGEFVFHPLFEADAAREAEETATCVESCRARFPDDDVAVLVRSRTQLPALLGELRRRKVRYGAVEIDRLTDLPEIIDLIALTRACCHLDDRAAWLGLLRGPLVGLDWTDLHRLVLDSSGAPVWALLNDAARVAGLSDYAKRTLDVFVPRMRLGLAVDRVQSLRHRIESAWFRLGGPGHVHDREQLDNAYRYLDVLEKIEAAGTLPDPVELEQQLEAERVSSRVDDDCRVQVMTMHKAKGLQFDHVILPSLGRHTSGGQRSVLSWLNVPADAGGSDMILSPVGPSFELENDPLHQYIEGALKKSDRLEQDRLLYVACTRARKTLRMIASIGLKGDADEIRMPHSGSLLHRLWPVLKERVLAARDTGSGRQSEVTEHRDDEHLVLPRLWRAADGWQMPAPPGLPQSPVADAHAPNADDRPVDFYWVGAAARHAGTVVHRWLQRFVVEEVRPALDEIDATLGLSRRWAQALGVSDEDLEAVCSRVSEALRGILSDSRGLWILDGPGHAEFRLTGVANDETASIVIDRVRIDEDGRHWIIDYKTSTHEGGDLAGFIDQEAERYTQQLARYARIYRNYAQAPEVRTALYFPLLQQFREVRIGEPQS